MQAIDLLNDNPDPTEEEVRLGPRGQPLPVHRLPEHRRGRAVRRGSRGRTAGARPMTAVDERPAAEPAAEVGRDRRRKEDQRLITGRTRWTDNITLPGHAAPRHGAQPVRARHDHRHRHRRRQATRPAWSPSITGARHRRRAGRPAQRLADHPRPGRARTTRRWPSTGSPSPARSSPWSWPAARPRRATRPSCVDVDYDELPARPRHGRQATPRTAAPWRTPTSAPTSRHSGSSTPPRPAPAATSTQAIAEAARATAS